MTPGWIGEEDIKRTKRLNRCLKVFMILIWATMVVALLGLKVGMIILLFVGIIFLSAKILDKINIGNFKFM